MIIVCLEQDFKKKILRIDRGRTAFEEAEKGLK